jgi:hypothetical protein
MNLFTIRTQTALALLVAAGLPQVAQSAGYKPFATDFGRAETPAVTQSSSYKPFVTDFPQARVSAVKSDSAASHYSAAALDAMGARYDAMADSYATRPAASYLPAEAVQAMGQRYQAQVAAADSTTSGYVVGGSLVSPGQANDPADQITAAAVTPVRPDDRSGIRGIDDTPVAAAAASGGFDWSDAGIGAVSGLGLSLLLVGGLVLGLTARREHKVAPV